MKVDGQIFLHPKYLALEILLGEIALCKLARLWGHCEANQRGEFWAGKFEGYVESVASWKGEPDALYNALKKTGWIRRERHGTRISGWESNNSRAVSNWKLGLIPKTKTHKPTTSLGLTKAEPTLSLMNERMKGTKEEEGAEISKESTVPQQKFVNNGTVQFAALTARIKALEELRKASELTEEDRRDLKEKKAALLELQERQARGEKA